MPAGVFCARVHDDVPMCHGQISPGVVVERR